MGVYARHVYYDIYDEKWWGCMPDMSYYDIFDGGVCPTCPIMTYLWWNGTTCILHIVSVMLHCWVGVVALLVVVVVFVVALWCEVMLIIRDGCIWNNDADVILWFKLLNSFLWIMCLLLLNVNLTPSVEIAALWASADNQE